MFYNEIASADPAKLILINKLLKKIISKFTKKKLIKISDGLETEY